jgi:uncharacterized protein (TIGR00255 family)
MIKSMTGFGNATGVIKDIGRVGVEIKTTNHRFLEVIARLPEGFLSLEEAIRKQICRRLKRGRVICQVVLALPTKEKVEVNRRLLGEYLSAARQIKKQARTKDDISLNRLMGLPGVLTLSAVPLGAERLWPQLRILLSQAIENLLRMRAKEGAALYADIKERLQKIQHTAEMIRARIKKLLREKTAFIANPDEKSRFLKDADISEELTRLRFHLKNFLRKLQAKDPQGKELDFISQEMQREANTIAAKSIDGRISSWVVQVRSQIEKVREQLQNVE